MNGCSNFEYKVTELVYMLLLGGLSLLWIDWLCESLLERKEEMARVAASTVNLAPSNWASNWSRGVDLQAGCNTQLKTHTENTDHI